jgi:Holliday junction resolvase RusA-like endonuclease
MDTESFLMSLNGEIRLENPDYKKIKELFLEYYCSITGEYIDDIGLIDSDKEAQIIKAINKTLFAANPQFSSMLLRNNPVMVPIFSTDLSSKISLLSQFSCPICKCDDPFPIVTFNIRISAISRNSSNKKKKSAFKKALQDHFTGMKNLFISKGKFCVFIIFVLGKGSDNKDLDNMSKPFLDALRGIIIHDDEDIDHLNMVKILHNDDEDYITLNIRKTEINNHSDTLFKSFHHQWGARLINIEDYM